MIHLGSRTSALHFIRLVLLVLTLLESCACVAVLVAKVTTCLEISLIHHVRLPNVVKVGFNVSFFIKVANAGLMFLSFCGKIMSSGALATIATCTHLCVVTNLGLLPLLGKEGDVPIEKNLNGLTCCLFSLTLKIQDIHKIGSATNNILKHSNSLVIIDKRVGAHLIELVYLGTTEGNKFTLGVVLVASV